MATTRTVYLRNSNNITMKDDGSHTRGDPVAVVASQVDMTAGVICFALAVVHPKDHFIKRRARAIAIGRLNELCQPDVCAAHGKNDRGILSGHDVKNILARKNGHEITKCIMQEIERLSNLPNDVRKVPTRIGKLATKWLAFAAMPKPADKSPTIPCPPHRNAVLPPPMPRA